MSETPVETIRRAAVLMRERAGAATKHPWEHPLDYEVTRGYRQDGPRHIATWIATADAGDGDIGDEEARANAEHIASWHPGVAVAVANWLQLEAADYTGHGEDENGHYAYALDVARTYLGEAAA